MTSNIPLMIATHHRVVDLTGMISTYKIRHTALYHTNDMKDYNYADGLERIEIARGMVRMDFYQTEEEKTSPYDPDTCQEHETTERLVMPADAFLRAFKAMGKIVSQLQSSGEHAPQQPEPPRRFGSSRPYAPVPPSPTGTGSHSGFIS